MRKRWNVLDVAAAEGKTHKVRLVESTHTRLGARRLVRRFEKAHEKTHEECEPGCSSLWRYEIVRAS